MSYKNFDELIGEIQKKPVTKKVVVSAAHDDHTLEAVFRARNCRIADPILVGDQSKIKNILSQMDESIDDDQIIHVDSDLDAARMSVDIIRQGKADILMKGKLDTSVMLKAVVNKESGIGRGGIMSMLVFHEIASYPKLLAVTDGGMMLYPTLEEKKMIITNAVDMMVSMGYDNPKVGVLAAIEKVNPKMPETVDAAKLKEMNQLGEIKNCYLEGPISYDLVMSPESASIKGFESPVVGDADLLVVPNITAGNILGKCLVYSAGAKMAGIIVGAKAPIVLTSRGSSSEEKFLSLVLSALAHSKL